MGRIVVGKHHVAVSFMTLCGAECQAVGCQNFGKGCWGIVTGTEQAANVARA